MKQRAPLDYDAIEQAFFEAEREGDKIDHETVVSSVQAETAYFESISDLLLSQVLENGEFQSLAFRHLARSVLSWAVFRPVLESLSNPDLFNRTVMWLYRDQALPPENFNMVVKTSKSKNEIQAVLERITAQLKSCHAQDAQTDSHDLREQLESLRTLQQMCEKRLLDLQQPRSRASALNSQPEPSPEPTYEERISDASSVFSGQQQDQLLWGVDPNNMDFNDILNSPVLLDLFSSFLKAKKRYNYIAFVMNAQGLFYFPVTCFQL